MAARVRIPPGHEYSTNLLALGARCWRCRSRRRCIGSPAERRRCTIRTIVVVTAGMVADLASSTRYDAPKPRVPVNDTPAGGARVKATPSDRPRDRQWHRAADNGELTNALPGQIVRDRCIVEPRVIGWLYDAEPSCWSPGPDGGALHGASGVRFSAGYAIRVMPRQNASRPVAASWSNAARQNSGARMKDLWLKLPRMCS